MTIQKDPCNDFPGHLVEFDNITVIKNNRVVLDRLTVKIDEGENIAILGPNGAGKSSFIKTVTREYYPVLDKGRVTFRVRGQEVWDVFEMRSTIGIVSSDLQQTFARNMTAHEVILSGYFSSVGVYNREVSCEMQEKADAILTFLEITHLKDRTMTEISSGEARRILIGRALVNNPKTLILDEPTNSLDLHSLHTFRKIMRKIAQSGTGIILVTHNLHDIIPEISRVILMRDGTFCRDGPKEEILTDRNIRNLFRVPVHIREECGYYYATGY
jgi:iron complex transport system ATP-binding protein